MMQAVLYFWENLDLWEQAMVALLDAWLKGLVLLGLAGLLNLAMRRASASARHLLWSLTLAGLLALFPLSLLGPRTWTLPLLPRLVNAPDETPLPKDLSNTTDLNAPQTGAGWPIEAQPLVPAFDPAQAEAPGLSQPDVRSTGLATPRPETTILTAPDWMHGIVGVWLAGALGALFPLAAGLALIRRLRKKAQPFDGNSDVARLLPELTQALQINARVQVVRVPAGTMPMATGLRRARVLLPADALEWPPGALTCAAAITMARRSQLEGRLLAILDAERNRSGLTARRLALACTAAAVGLWACSSVRLTPPQEGLETGTVRLVVQERDQTQGRWVWEIDEDQTGTCLTQDNQPRFSVGGGGKRRMILEVSLHEGQLKSEIELQHLRLGLFGATAGMEPSGATTARTLDEVVPWLNETPSSIYTQTRTPLFTFDPHWAAQTSWKEVGGDYFINTGTTPVLTGPKVNWPESKKTVTNDRQNLAQQSDLNIKLLQSDQTLSFSNGAKARLIGISDPKSLEEVAWRANGQMRAEPPEGFESVDFPPMSTAPWIYRKFMIQIESQDVRSMNVTYQIRPGGRSCDRKQIHDNRLDLAITDTLPADTKQANLRLGLAHAPWTTLAQWDADQRGSQTASFNAQDYTILYDLSFTRHPGLQAITVTDNAIDLVHRIVALNQHGALVQSSGSDLKGTRDMRQTTFFFSTSDPLTSFQFQVRDYEWQGWQDIQLTPQEALSPADPPIKLTDVRYLSSPPPGGDSAPFLMISWFLEHPTSMTLPLSIQKSGDPTRHSLGSITFGESTKEQIHWIADSQLQPFLREMKNEHVRLWLQPPDAPAFASDWIRLKPNIEEPFTKLNAMGCTSSWRTIITLKNDTQERPELGIMLRSVEDGFGVQVLPGSSTRLLELPASPYPTQMMKAVAENPKALEESTLNVIQAQADGLVSLALLTPQGQTWCMIIDATLNLDQTFYAWEMPASHPLLCARNATTGAEILKLDLAEHKLLTQIRPGGPWDYRLECECLNPEEEGARRYVARLSQRQGDNPWSEPLVSGQFEHPRPGQPLPSQPLLENDELKIMLETRPWTP